MLKRYIHWFLGLSLLMTCLSFNVFADDDEDDENDPLKEKKQKSRIYVGPVVGFNRVQQTGGFLSQSTDVSCPSFKDGSANGFFAGVSFEYLIGDPKSSKSSIIARLLYNTMPSTFVTPGDNLPSLVRINNVDEVRTSTTENEARISYNLVNLELMYRFSLGNTPFGIVAGPDIGYAITQNLDQDYKLIAPSNAVFLSSIATNPSVKGVDNPSAPRTAFLQRGAMENAQKLRLAIKAGIQYEIILRRITVIPSINYNFGILGIRSDYPSWRVSAIQPQLDIRFAL
jgi:hypothetical protein